jgi:hypothetical protein
VDGSWDESLVEPGSQARSEKRWQDWAEDALKDDVCLLRWAGAAVPNLGDAANSNGSDHPRSEALKANANCVRQILTRSSPGDEGAEKARKEKARKEARKSLKDDINIQLQNTVKHLVKAATEESGGWVQTSATKLGEPHVPTETHQLLARAIQAGKSTSVCTGVIESVPEAKPRGGEATAKKEDDDS